MSYDVKAASGQFFGRIFAFPLKVYYEDTDAGGIVYYANYLKFAERARTEYLTALQFNQQQKLEENRCGFTVRKCAVDYLKPAVLGDSLIVTCEVREVKGATAEMYQEIRRGDELLATVTVKAAYVDLERKRPTRIPEGLLTQM